MLFLILIINLLFPFPSIALLRRVQSQVITMTYIAPKQLKSVDMKLMWVNEAEIEIFEACIVIWNCTGENMRFH